MSDWIDAEGYRANVGIVLMRDTGEVFLGQRTGGRGWQFPQGGVRQGEPVEQALFRELQEEIGLERQHVSLVGLHRATGSVIKLPKRYVRRGRGPTCIGQKQRWFLLQARGARRLASNSVSRIPTSRNSTAGAGQTTGSRCAR